MYGLSSRVSSAKAGSPHHGIRSACRPLPVAMVLRFAALPVRRRMGVVETDKPLAVRP
jgi:hypothetical protein